MPTDVGLCSLLLCRSVRDVLLQKVTKKRGLVRLPPTYLGPYLVQVHTTEPPRHGFRRNLSLSLARSLAPSLSLSLSFDSLAVKMKVVTARKTKIACSYSLARRVSVSRGTLSSDCGCSTFYTHVHERCTNAATWCIPNSLARWPWIAFMRMKSSKTTQYRR